MRLRAAAKLSVLFSEPKIPQSRRTAWSARSQSRFQCSSASRKFLNAADQELLRLRNRPFSALQRAENSSIRNIGDANRPPPDRLSVLFSEPKIPQCCCCCCWCSAVCLSVLFSEPKIPQCSFAASRLTSVCTFSALQRAENSSMRADFKQKPMSFIFQCSSASRKFLNTRS